MSTILSFIQNANASFTLDSGELEKLIGKMKLEEKDQSHQKQTNESSSTSHQQDQILAEYKYLFSLNPDQQRMKISTYASQQLAILITNFPVGAPKELLALLVQAQSNQ
jgi:Zn-finger nucleic acid-binding protein